MPQTLSLTAIVALLPAPHAECLQALAKLFDPLVAWMAPRYQAVVGRELRKYGLRYEDLYDPQYDLVRRMLQEGSPSACPFLCLCVGVVGVDGRGGIRSAARSRCDPAEGLIAQHGMARGAASTTLHVACIRGNACLGRMQPPACRVSPLPCCLALHLFLEISACTGHSGQVPDR